ncbi:hypothetical protein UFOVP152_8 [uncultured Caudovirales phage]|uniref:Large polyvalent protein associated domain-containing protein n=1 Tax=uncultured Caudovirales phage TaxID=2100421 RepID=A0A6J7WC82_9CAUD|nr:hypothetical protein UFOVP152_8 [uncultured Caudovirales phage]
MATDYDSIVGGWQKPHQNKYDDIVDGWGQNEAAQIRANSIVAADVNPDQFAQQRNTARRVGLPVAAVAPAPAVPQRQAVAQQVDQHTQGAPVARRAYTDPDFARLGHDDAHTTGLLDRLMQFAVTPSGAQMTTSSPLGTGIALIEAIGHMFGYKPGDLETSVVHGTAAGSSSIVRGAGALGDIKRKLLNTVTGGNPVANMLINGATFMGALPSSGDVRPIVSSLDAKAQELEARVQVHGRLAQGADMIGGLVPYLFGGEGAPILMALSGAGSQADAAERAGKYGTAASDFGIVANAGFQGVLGTFLGGENFARLVPKFGGALADGADSVISKAFNGGDSNLITRALAQTVGEGGEAGARLLARTGGAGLVGATMQGGANLIEKVSVNPDKDIADGVTDSAESMALLDLGLHALRAVGHSAASRYVAASHGKAEGDLLDGLHLIAEASKVRERAPDVWQAYLQQVTDEHGAPDAVYVAPEAFAHTFTSPEGRVALQRMPEAVRDAVKVSAASGGDVRIPVHEFGTYVAGTPLYEQLAEHIKTDPNSYTRAEAADILKTEGPRVLAELDRAVRGKAATDEFHASRDRVEQQITEQLDKAGRYSLDVNRINAKLGAHSIATTAAKVGMTPEDFYREHGFSVGNGDVRTASQALEQSAINKGGRDLPITENADRELQVASIPRVELSQDEAAKRFESDVRSKTSHLATGDAVVFNRARKVIFSKPRGGDDDLRHSVGVALPEVVKAAVPFARNVDGGKEYVHAIARVQIGGQDATVRLVLFRPHGENSPLRQLQVEGFEVARPANNPLPEGSGKMGPGRALNSVAQSHEDFKNDRLFQGEARGQFIPETNTINLLKDANLSTFIHELGHWHLETLAKFADSHPEVAKDFDTLLHWFDPDLTREQWDAMTFDQRRPHHEKLAQGFEQYLFEGRAPTRELRGIFQRMSAWLKNVYRSLTGIGVDLSPEVRQVMDRLVATPGEIRGAERDMGYMPAFDAKPEFMTDDQWSAYQALGMQATIDATEKLGARTIRDLQWFEGAKSRELRRMQGENAALRKAMREEVAQEIMAQPVERARRFLKHGEINGAKVEGGHKLNVDAVMRILGIEKGGKPAPLLAFAKRGPSLIEWISRRGGVWDGDPSGEFKGGDLEATGLGDWHKQAPFRKKAIRDPKLGAGDFGIDNTLRDAISAGYFPELEGASQERYDDLHDQQILINAINDELAGKPRYQGQGQEYAAPDDHASLKSYAAAIDEVAGSFGVNPLELEQEFTDYAARLHRDGMPPREAFAAAVNDYAAAALHDAHEETGDADYATTREGGEGQAVERGRSRTSQEGSGTFGKSELRAELGFGKYGVLGRKGALDPELVADQFGYASAREMLHDLVTSPKARDKIADRTDQYMLERYGDIDSPQAMAEAAIEAVHSDARGRMLATEYSSLSKALGRKSEIAQAARDSAEQLVGQIRIADLKAERFRAEERKAGEKAERAIRDNDLEAAAAMKRAQILNFHLSRAVDKARDETAKVITYFKKLDREAPRRAMGGEAAAQIDAILERFDLRSSTTNKTIEERKSLLEWVTDQQAQGFDPKIDPAVLNEASRKAFRDMTLDEVRALHDTIRSIDHIGRQEQKVADGQRRIALENAVSEVLHNTADMPRVKISDRRNPEIGGKGLDRFSGKFMKASSFVRSADAALLKMEQLFDWLDRKNPGGVFNRLVFRRLAEAQGTENDMLHEVAGKMAALAEALPRSERSQLAELITAPELIDSRTGKPSILAKSQIISIALNSANESNFGKMLKGEGWEADAVKAVLDRHLTSADIAYINGVIRTIEGLWPKIEAMEKRLSGVAPDKVQGRLFELVNGTIEGGYFPVVYDPSRSYGAERYAALDAATRTDQMFDAQYVKATTAKGHTIERTGYSAPILLDLNVIPQRVSQVIHDIAYREAIMDADRFLSHPEVRKAITDVMGKEYYQQIRPWLKAIANDRVIDQAGQAWFDKLFHWGRTTTTMLGLGFRASTMLIHGSSAASNSVAEVGTHWMRKGVSAFIGSPEKMRDAHAFVTDRSAEMRHRMNEVDRDVRESIREMELRSAQGSTAPVMRVLDKGREMAFYGIGALDMASALPTWLGAYMKAMEVPEKGGLGMSENDAIYFADKAVRNAHGGGGIKDLARAQRGSEAEKLFTMFYSFWNHIYNRQRDLFRDARDISSAGDFANVVARSWFYLVIPQLLHAALKPPSQESQDDEGTATAWLHWAGEEIALGFTAGIPVMRDVANSALTGRDYEATPVAKIANDLLTEGKDVSHWIQGEDDKIHNPVKHAATTVGIATGLPLGQAGQTAQFLWDVIDGDQRPEDIGDWWNGIVYGRIQH